MTTQHVKATIAVEKAEKKGLCGRLAHERRGEEGNRRRIRENSEKNKAVGLFKQTEEGPCRLRPKGLQRGGRGHDPCRQRGVGRVSVETLQNLSRRKRSNVWVTATGENEHAGSSWVEDSRGPLKFTLDRGGGSR